MNEPVNDSIISAQEQIIELKTLEGESIQFDLSACEQRSDELTLDNASLTVKVRRNRRIAIIEGVGLVGISVLLFTVK